MFFCVPSYGLEEHHLSQLSPIKTRFLPLHLNLNLLKIVNWMYIKLIVNFIYFSSVNLENVLYKLVVRNSSNNNHISIYYSSHLIFDKYYYLYIAVLVVIILQYSNFLKNLYIILKRIWLVTSSVHCNLRWNNTAITV